MISPADRGSLSRSGLSGNRQVRYQHPQVRPWLRQRLDDPAHALEVKPVAEGEVLRLGWAKGESIIHSCRFYLALLGLFKLGGVRPPKSDFAFTQPEPIAAEGRAGGMSAAGESRRCGNRVADGI